MITLAYFNMAAEILPANWGKFGIRSSASDQGSKRKVVEEARGSQGSSSAGMKKQRTTQVAVKKQQTSRKGAPAIQQQFKRQKRIVRGALAAKSKIKKQETSSSRPVQRASRGKHTLQAEPLTEEERQRRKQLASDAFSRFQVAMAQQYPSANLETVYKAARECLHRYYGLNLGVDEDGRQVAGKDGCTSGIVCGLLSDMPVVHT